jgi:hypothetical protein
MAGEMGKRERQGMREGMREGVGGTHMPGSIVTTILGFKP